MHAFCLRIEWLICGLVLGCGGCQDRPSTAPVTILCAASTEQPVKQAAASFHEQTGTAVRVVSGPSNGLAAQILAGSPADLFLSANRRWADEVSQHVDVHESQTIATNRLVLIVPCDSSLEVSSPTELMAADVGRIAVAAEQVPAGEYARAALQFYGVLESLKTQKRLIPGHDVRTALRYTERGEVAAGIVYATDAASSDRVRVAFEFPAEAHPPIEYVLVRLSDRAEAIAFFEFLRRSGGLRGFAQSGFHTEPVSTAKETP